MTTITKSIKKRMSITVATTAFAVIGALAMPAVFAETETSLGNHSQDEIRSACNAAGGELLGVSDSGSYGCEVASKGTMILCHMDQSCTGYTPDRTRSGRKRILDILSQGAKVVAK